MRVRDHRLHFINTIRRMLNLKLLTFLSNFSTYASDNILSSGLVSAISQGDEASLFAIKVEFLQILESF